MSRAEDLWNRLETDGLGAIDGFIADRTSEYLFLDFKRSADDGAGTSVHNNDRENLSKAISGFGNSDGGVVVWGVDCSKDTAGADVAKAKHPLSDAIRFASQLEGLISGRTVPPHASVLNRPVVSGPKAQGFVVTLVPKSNATPLQAVPSLRYYMRSGSSFEPVPHGVLAGLFGRSPQADVVPSIDLDLVTTQNRPLHNGTHFQIVIQVFINISNLGRGIARDLFVTLDHLQLPGPNSEHALWADEQDKHWHKLPGSSFAIVGQDWLKLPPNGRIRSVRFSLQLAPPFERPLLLGLTVGAEGAVPRSLDVRTSPEVIQHEWGAVQTKGINA